MFNSLTEIASKIKLVFEKEDLLYEKDILNIYNSENPESLNLNFNDGIILNWIGLYYNLYNKNDDLMIKYYSMGVEIKNIGCMLCLAQYYQGIKDYNNMIKYYQLAIENDCFQAMYILGKYYFDNNNFIESHKYLNMIPSTIMNKIRKNEIKLNSLNDKIYLFKSKIELIILFFEDKNYFKEITDLPEIVNKGEIGWVNKKTYESLYEIKKIFRSVSLNFNL